MKRVFLDIDKIPLGEVVKVRNSIHCFKTEVSKTFNIGNGNFNINIGKIFS